MPHSTQLSPPPLWPQLTRPSKGPQMTPERPQRVPWPYHLSGSGFVGASWLPGPAGGRPSWVEPCPAQFRCKMRVEAEHPVPPPPVGEFHFA